MDDAAVRAAARKVTGRCSDAASVGSNDAINRSPSTAATLSASPVGTAPVGSSVTFTASATGCTTPEYQFWAKAPGAAWSIVRPYSSSSTFSWSTTGLPSGA